MSHLRTLIVFTLLTGAALVAQAATSPIETPVIVIKGRFVDADTGKPLPRCHVRFSGHESTGYSLAWAHMDWSDPPEQTTGEDGTFRFALRMPALSASPHSPPRFHIRSSQSHHCAWFSHCLWATAKQSNGIDYGDIPLRKSFRPRIRCIDTNGTLQPGVTLSVRPTEYDNSLVTLADFGPKSWTHQADRGLTDIDGYLHMRDGLPGGEYNVKVRSRTAHKLPKTFSLPNSEAIEVVVKALPASQVVAGKLVHEDGTPIAGARLQVRVGTAKPSCITRRDGRFTLYCKSPSDDRATISVARNRRYDGWLELDTLQWGTTDATLVLPSRTKTTFVVTDSAGKPVPNCNIYCLPVEAESKRPTVRQAGDFSDGRILCRLAPGDYYVRVAPRSDLLQPTTWQNLTIAAGSSEHAIRLLPTQQRSIAVRFADGEVVKDAVVEVIDGEFEDVLEQVDPATQIRRPTGAQRVQLVAKSRCDANGIATVRLATPGPVWIRITGESVQSMIAQIDLRKKGEPVAIKVARGGALHGQFVTLQRLLDLNLDYDPNKPKTIYTGHGSGRPTITIVGPEGEVLRERIRINHLGHFDCYGLPAGQVSVKLSYRYWMHHNASRLAEPFLLGQFSIDLAKPLNVKFKVPRKLPNEGPNPAK